MNAVVNQPRVRVIEITGNAIIGGMERYVERLVAALPRMRFEVTCICPFESPFTAALRSHGADVFIMPVRDDPVWSSVVNLCALLRARQIHVMHAHLSNAHVLASIASAFTGVPVLATIHGRTIPLADAEICHLGGSHLSVVCQNALWHAQALGIPQSRVQMIGNGVDAARYTRPRPEPWLAERLGLAIATPLVGFVGRLSPEKAPARFIELAARLVARGAVHADGSAPHFCLVGAGPLRAALEAQVRAAGIESRVHFAGALAEMPEVYASLCALAMTSDSEGQPLALLEAMASGLPVVAPDIGGIAELIVHGETGWLVAPHDVDALAIALGEILAAPAEAARRGAAARLCMQQRFSHQASVEAMARLLERIRATSASQQTTGEAVTRLKAARKR